MPSGRTPGAKPNAIVHRRAPWKAYLSLRQHRQRAVGDGLYIGRRVHQCQFAIAGGRGLAQPHPGQLTSQTLAQQLVFGHGKAVSGGQWQDKVVGVEGLHEA